MAVTLAPIPTAQFQGPIEPSFADAIAIIAAAEVLPAGCSRIIATKQPL
jgi:hypothetical protein